MANVQKRFIEFHGKIRLGHYDENQTLRDKRDTVIDVLQRRLKAIFEEQGETPPTFTTFDQGSYAMRTGVKPLGDTSDYDIDEGVALDLDKNTYPDPVKVKKWVYDALNGHTKNVFVKTPCVTVAYSDNDEPIYHVDLAVYAHDGVNPETLYLARGKLEARPENRIWQRSDPKGLCKAIIERFSVEEEQKQFRRCIRYLKRWRDVQFSAGGNSAPVGIGITVAAYKWFVPVMVYDGFQNKYQDNDLSALLRFVDAMINQFSDVYADEQWWPRLKATLSVEPYDDPFARMTNPQMKDFKKKLERLRDTLRFAESKEVDPVEACKELAKQFGSDFPVPSGDDTGKPKAAAILTSSTSA